MDFVPSQRLRSRAATTAGAAGRSEAQLIPVFVSLRKRERRRRTVSCRFEGFHDLETSRGHRMLWSGGVAKISCTFLEKTAIRYVWVEVADTAPSGSIVQLFADEVQLVTHRCVKGRATIRARLPRRVTVTRINLRIHAQVFTPSEEWQESDDPRQLGVAVRGIAFGKSRTKYGPGMDFRRPVGQRLASIWSSLRRPRAA